ncbi:iron-containing redox enzyme family protein [Myxococcus sp. K15C18031901]|uniref:TenA family transcriptional regulator n=1 Tax=Myxococcus dinghuensis TaxID=2906761 RepID=UPI0020A80ED6|nr:iron-containing redox enzyme family protein [Myxococcus dinghuensis]MCP3098905.1 iron-containing redox enzyme family protein [Myxococcus dinghuensis]
MGASSLVRNLSLRNHVSALKTQWNVLESSDYLRALRDGAFERDDFVETQLQFFAAVAHFPRPMAVLASRLPRPEQRLPLVENLFDEHGRGSLAHGHESTFRLLLERLGADTGRLDRGDFGPAVRTFNAALSGIGTCEPPHVGLAVFGIIEDLFSGISLALGRGIVARGWLASDQMVHYPTHATLDEEHADGFYRQLDAPHASDTRMARDIEQGLALGGHLLLGLYEGLYRARRERGG